MSKTTKQQQENRNRRSSEADAEFAVLVAELRSLNIRSHRILADIERIQEEKRRIGVDTAAEEISGRISIQKLEQARATSPRADWKEKFPIGVPIVIRNKVNRPKDRETDHTYNDDIARYAVVTGHDIRGFQKRVQFVTLNNVDTWRDPKNIRLASVEEFEAAISFEGTVLFG